MQEDTCSIRPLYGVYLCCLMGSYMDIIKEQLALVHQSGLYDQTETLLMYITLYKDNMDTFDNMVDSFDPLKKIRRITTSTNEYEKFAINSFRKDIQAEEYDVYYFHTKGVSRPKGSIFERRRHILNYYTLSLPLLNRELLQTYDAVGCSLTERPSIHFSGNFWWARSSYLTKLEDAKSDYLSAEMFIGSGGGKLVSLSQTTNDGEVEMEKNRSIDIIRSELKETAITEDWKAK